MTIYRNTIYFVTMRLCDVICASTLLVFSPKSLFYSESLKGKPCNERQRTIQRPSFPDSNHVWQCMIQMPSSKPSPAPKKNNLWRKMKLDLAGSLRGRLFQMLHVWNVDLHLPQKWTKFTLW